MYWIKKVLHMLLLSSLLLVVLWASYNGYVWLSSAERLEERSEEETRSVVHWLPTDKFVSFNFSSSRTLAIRLLSNAIFDGQQAFDEPVNYAIEYQLLNQQDQILVEHVYHHASKLVLAAQEQQVKQIIEDRKALSVASGQSFYVDTSAYPSASKIRLKLLPEEDALRGVVVRLHAKTPADNDGSQQIWLKLPLEWRDRMLNYHTLGGNALTQWELSNAVSFDWQKLAPQGIPNIDFVSDILYETLPYNVITYDFSAQQLDLDSFYTSKELTATFRVSNNQALTFSSTTPLSTLRITWHDLNQLMAPKELVAKPLANDVYQIDDVHPGLITVQSSLPALTQWRQAEQPIVPLHSYYYIMSPSTPAIYSVAGNSDIVFDFRDLDTLASVANITILNKSEQPIERYKLELEPLTSQFDRLITPETQRQTINESQKFFLRLASEAAKVVIDTPDSVAVKLQSRSPAFHYQNVLCDKLCENPLPDFIEIGAWFAQKAVNEFSFTELQQILKVRLFEAPPLPIVKDTSYVSESLFDKHPISNTALVHSPSSYFEPPEEPSPAHYRKVGELEKLTIPTTNDLKSPKLIAISEQVPKYTEADLTASAVSKVHSLNKRSPRVYTNTGKTRDYIKTRLFKISQGETLSLQYNNRAKPVSIVVKPFLYPVTTKTDQAIMINTNLYGQYRKGINSEYTIAEKRYALLPANREAFMLHPQSTQILSYPPITIKIGTDIQSLEKFAITAEHEMWITILEEHNAQPLTPVWWQNENI
ncbi:hypothetical protein N474_06340 [Pseudoalteromonas luteoviolacea CPMOR-2]|uniref:Uncharacterized protein n=1 Tax=Pseudoalteromonas luteoviolacea DSM 6061 TaxID=1365250 RepID=A0A166YFC0_9GAMM|nr:hypothetical protein [Pseudoalteromonas luteoviolacea]KZN42576.1 hypothetical protein N475_09610 [Pseudoalteromonas luteoviolacea DSM 6061]KZN60011.1 hypothetical protein N474_06340 [Pseudoalteromonas luteoviolacea CPMOR-2]MBE0385230.1 hypothetical protein [Pseudoalteromonas luteoviolacea DSM 6061]